MDTSTNSPITVAKPQPPATVTTPDRPAPGAATHGFFKTVGIGLLVGLTGGAALVALQSLVRFVAGVGTPPELAGDRIAPLLTIGQFFDLLNAFGSYDALKQFGVGAGILGEFAGAALLGIVYALLSRRAARRGSRGRGAKLVVLLATLGGLVAVSAALWPVLGTNFRGLPATAARVASLGVLTVTFAAMALVIVSLYRWIVGPRAQSTANGPVSSDLTLGRRTILAGGLGASLAVTGGGMISLLSRRATFSYDGTQLNGPTITPITDNEDFYVVTKNVIDPRVVASLWRLEVTGTVGAPVTFDLDELREMPSVQQETTLMCISNSVGGGLESNAVWTGVPLRDLIMAAQPEPGAVEVVLTAVDGYSDTFSFEKAMAPTTLVAFGMNGEPLPQRHGFPARIIVPGMFGEKHVKWLRTIEVVDTERKGFYESQGWGPEFTVPLRSRFTGPDLREPVRVGQSIDLVGTAYGADIGIAAVEVSVDGGATWNVASLTYAGPAESWSLWSYTWLPTAPGEQSLVVRATDRNGLVQTSQRRGISPEGATGYHMVTANVL